MNDPNMNPPLDDQGRRSPLPTHAGKPSQSNTGWIIAIVMVCVFVVIVCPVFTILMALLLPAVQVARDSARTMQSSNNLKQIGLAMHNYHAQNGSFPPAYVPDANGRPMKSWRTMILPYLEQSNLYDMADNDLAWDDPANAMLLETEVQTYISPRDHARGLATTNYVAVTGEQTILSGAEPTSIDAIRDGTSNTIMIVEIVNSDIPWFEPRDIDIDSYTRVADGDDPDDLNVIPRRGVVLFADVSVQTLDESVTREMLRKNFTKSGGERNSRW